MPIVMQQRGTGAIRGGVCRKDSFEETMAIIEVGIGKGCSLKLAKPTTNSLPP